jgi:hypothetical protein
MWNFQLEATKYCKLDCKVLHEILTQFNELIFKEFQVNIHNSPTLPSLAMKIYKTHYMPENTIYQILNKPYWNIRESYTGGAVDVYIPHNKISGFFNKVKALFKLLYYYDVNSLYPAIMANTPMPVGKPIAFDGNIRNVEPEAYGFFYCKITSPVYLKHPLLHRKIKTAGGMRTIAGLGSWEGWIYSLEMDNAAKYGYTFEILKGYQFEKGFVFKEYVDTMYNLRIEYDKGHPMNLIAKLLMNSLYGKFGMKLESTVVEIFDRTNESENQILNDMLELYGETLRDYIEIENKVLTVRTKLIGYKNNDDEEMYHGLDVNIAIASAISAGGRIWMSTIKNNPNINLYYSDTDSGVTDAPLPDILVGPLLGQFKLEYTIKRAIFLAPKVYAFTTTDNEEILKIKGISKDNLENVNINDIEELLVKDSTKEFNQTKWFKKVIVGDITVKEVAYTLKATSNKRLPIYIKQEGFEIFNSTEPYNYDDIKPK